MPLPIFKSFNRDFDNHLITKETIIWSGPFSWPGFESENNLPLLPNISGVYLFSFKYKDGYILRSAGITNSTKRRFQQHKRAYMKGNYTILDVNQAQIGVRKEIWHGWSYAKYNRDQFDLNKTQILNAAIVELTSLQIFTAEILEKRKQERIEFSIIAEAYLSQKAWSNLIDGGMNLKSRDNSEIPIEVNNLCSHKIYGLPEKMEI